VGSNDWVAALDAALAARPGPDGAPVTVQHQLGDGGPAWFVQAAGGRLAARPGRADAADITLTWEPAAAEAVHAGELSALVALDQGRLAVHGDLVVLARLAPALAGLDRVER
jgi:hypothetical protein